MTHFGDLVDYQLTKGHGTGNDFLLFADPDARAELGPSEIAAVSDRHRGVGADGVIRAVRYDALATIDPAVADLHASNPGAEWFMDYRNADGSLAEMCGNGIRVFVAYLLDQGLIDLPEGQSIGIATRAGVLQVARHRLGFSARMGQYQLPGGQETRQAGFDVVVRVRDLDGDRPGLRVAMPNPHTVIAVQTAEELHNLDLTSPPVLDPTPQAGSNVEIVHVTGERETQEGPVGTLEMRVHERGVGETLSCGTGACAAAVAAAVWCGHGAPTRWQVTVPGGKLEVILGPDGVIDLAGPAALVGAVQLRGER